jgi:hypothetical protein
MRQYPADRRIDLRHGRIQPQFQKKQQLLRRERRFLWLEIRVSWKFSTSFRYPRIRSSASVACRRGSVSGGVLLPRWRSIAYFSQSSLRASNAW